MRAHGRPALSLAVLVVAVLVIALTGVGCHPKPAERQTSAPGANLQTNLDKVFVSPSGLYTIRYNHSWPEQQVITEVGVLDLFTLSTATVAVETEAVPPGTRLEGLIEQTMAQYRSVNIQGLERAGSVDIGGGHGELVRAVTYVNSQGMTVASAPTPSAPPRNLYQAFYLAGNQRYTFSVAWPQGDKTDYLKLFRSILQTFALAGTT